MKLAAYALVTANRCDNRKSRLRTEQLRVGIADDLVGQSFNGRGKTPRVWTVTEKVATIEGQSPGFFSVAYRCRDADGSVAFMKASDLSRVLSSNTNDMMQVLADATQAHKFERDILDHCQGNRMDRVVTALDYGNESVVHEGVVDFLFFLVFELAEGDLRRRIVGRESLDLIWTVSALHEFAVAVQQLHNGSVYHNDIKPANALVFSNASQKIADLGRATSPLMSASHEKSQCVGDRRFAPPEQIYPLQKPIQPEERFIFQRAGDLYNLGSLAHFLLVGTSMTQEVIGRLRPEHRPPSVAGGWRDDVEQVIPFWQSSMAEVLQDASQLADDYTSGIVKNEIDNLVVMIREICEPNWRIRGAPKSGQSSNRLDLARYIARLDLARTRLSVALRNAK